MSPHRHLSCLEVDEVVTGLAPPPLHLVGCAACRSRVEEGRARSESFGAHPKAREQLRLLSTWAATPPGASWTASSARRGAWRYVALSSASLLAALAVFLWHQDAPPDALRFKGAPAVMLVDGADHPVTRATPGQRLRLVVGGGGYSYAAVFAVADDGTTVRLWPRAGDTFGQLAPGARETLTQVVVTPGGVTVRALFAGRPVPLSESGEEAKTLRITVP